MPKTNTVLKKSTNFDPLDWKNYYSNSVMIDDVRKYFKNNRKFLFILADKTVQQ